MKKNHQQPEEIIDAEIKLGIGEATESELQKSKRIKFRIMVGENIRAARLRRNMSIEELAELLTLTSGFVGLIERGTRGASSYNICRLAQVFGMTADDLYKGTDPLSVGSENKEALLKKMTALAGNLAEDRIEFIIEAIKALYRLD